MGNHINALIIAMGIIIETITYQYLSPYQNCKKSLEEKGFCTVQIAERC